MVVVVYYVPDDASIWNIIINMYDDVDWFI